MASLSEPVTFREFCPLYYLLNAIPTKIQKGFRSVVVYLTALDASEDYIALGSSVGMLYLYCRQLSRMKKYNFEGKMESITIVKLLSCFDDLVAAGTASGRVAVFQLVSSLPGRNKQLRRFDVTGIHKNSITALAWSPNGMKLFSGDDKGKIVYSSLDLDQGVCNSQLVLEEPSSIVQLDYSQKVLLVSTLQRSLLFYTEEKSVKQVGTQPRKTAGKFGACFIPGLCKQSDLTLYASRPGLRLWKADVHGTVQATFILKDVFAGGVKPLELYPRLESTDRGRWSFPERHLGLVSCFFQEGWVLSWNEYSIYLLDTVTQATVAGLESSGDIVSVSCTENEIFFLKGDRNIIRLSSKPEGPASIARAGLEMSGCAERVHVQRGEKPLGAAVLETRLRGSSVASEPRSRSSSLNSTDSGSGLLPPALQAAPELGKGGQPSIQRFSVISSEDFDQELVVNPVRVKKKRRKKKPESGSGKACPSSLESTPCWELPGDRSPSWSTDLLSLASSPLSSRMDQLSSGSPDCESNLSGELNGASQGNDDSEALCVLEVPGPTAGFLDANKDSRTEMPQCDQAREVDVHNGELNLPWLPREHEKGGRVMEFREEPSPAGDGPMSQQLPPQKQKGTPESHEAPAVQPEDPQSTSPTVPLLDSLVVPSSLSTAWGPEQAWPGPPADQGSAQEPGEEQGFLMGLGAPGCVGTNPWPEATEEGTSQEEVAISDCDLGQVGRKENPPVSALAAVAREPPEQPSRDQVLTSSDEEDIYAHGLPSPSSETSMTELGAGCSLQGLSQPVTGEPGLMRSDQFAESWMGYSGPGCGILSLAVSEKYIWCLDYKGGLFCSALPGAGLRWQKFEDAVQQVAVSPSGALLWKIEQKSNRAFACGKVTIRGKRHWYEALPQTVFVALSDDTAWIIRTNGDLYLQTGLSVDRPCARATKVDCPYPLSQVTARDSVVWALTEQRALLFREGVSSFCPEGEQWKWDIISERQALEPVCIALGHKQTLWALDIHGSLWFRTGIVSKKPQGDDDHWWQVGITDYVVFDQCSLFQTLLHATHSVATAAQVPVEKVADKLRTAFWSQQLQCQPSLLGVNHSGVWISSGKNEFHVAKGSLVGTYWNTVVPRGTASATKWAFVLASAAPTKEGSCLWLCQSSQELCSVSAQDARSRPSTVQLPPDAEMRVYSACPDALWALDSLGQVFIRTLSKSCPTGMHWTKLDLSQLEFFSYETSKSVIVKTWTIGLINRTVQLLIISYFVGWVFLHEKAYQVRDTAIESSVVTKVKGSGRYANRVMDVSDYVTPPQGTSVFVVITKMIVTENQKQGFCPESEEKYRCVSDSQCRPERFPGGAILTGRCVNYSSALRTCEIQGWCPAEVDTVEMPVMKEAENFTIFIKNNIRFPLFNFEKGNLLPNLTAAALKTCRFHPNKDSLCPILRVGDVVKFAGQDFAKLASTGGVLGIKIAWVCDLDKAWDQCIPKYSFTRLDGASGKSRISPGYNFRFAKYYKMENGSEYRTLLKAFGIRFDVLVHGNAGKFNIIPTIITSMAAFTSVGVGTVLCDIILLNFLKGADQYKAKKFEEVSERTLNIPTSASPARPKDQATEEKQSTDSGAYSIGH